MTPQRDSIFRFLNKNPKKPLNHIFRQNSKRHDKVHILIRKKFRHKSALLIFF